MCINVLTLILFGYSDNINAVESVIRVCPVDLPKIWKPFPLHLAAENGNVQMTMQVKTKLLINGKMVCSGRDMIAEILIKNGADVNARDNLQRTPLHIAAVNGN